MKDCLIDLANVLPPGLELLPATALPDFEIPLFSSAISAGFPSPAENYLDEAINLQQFLIKNAAATYLLRVRGNSMCDANISEGDILIVDRSVKPGVGQIIIGLLDNEFTVKRLIKKNNQYYLQPENPAYPVIPLPDESQFQVWGVVTWCIHKINRNA
jgi:DNA polymerase V